MPDPAPSRRELGRELGALRKAAGLAQRDMYPDVEDRTAQSRASRTEKGLRVPALAELNAWLSLTDAGGDARVKVHDLLDRVNRGVEPWDEAEGGHLQWMASEREEASTLIRNCSMSWIPGLLQTWDYARLIVPQTDPYGFIDHAAAVQARMDRQLILSREGRRFEFLVGENAVRWSPGPGVMGAQRARLLQAATNSSLELRVLPSGREGDPDWGNFVIYTPEDESEPTAVATEYPHGGSFNADPKGVATFERIWAGLWDASLTGADAVELIRSVSR